MKLESVGRQTRRWTKYHDILSIPDLAGRLHRRVTAFAILGFPHKLHGVHA